MIKKALARALSLFLVLGSFSSLAPAAMAAQGSNTGRLSGTVTNPQGEVIGGATVTVTDTQTGKEVTNTTTGEGTFAFANLNIGNYTVKVSAPGFKTHTATDVKIDVGKEYNLNVPLEVGAVSENVTVTAGAEVINASNAELSNTVSTQQIKELPLNGRNPLSLIGLQPGTSQNGATNTVINGQRSSFTNITRDGVNVQDNFIRANATDFIPDRPNVDDVSEFTIVTQNAGAELGNGSSQIQLVTPRGGNQFHGAGYIYNRNSAFSANSFFNNASGNFADGTPKVPLPFLNRNQFGGSASGPLVKEKFFFFGAYEGFRQRSSSPFLRTILLPQARNGVFTYLDSTPAASGGPVRRTVNVLELAGLPADPLIADRILSQVPTVGNTTDAGDQLNTTGFRLNRSGNIDRDAYTTRLDYSINQNNTLNGVYSYKKEFNQRTDIDAQQGGVAAGYTASPFGFQDAHTHFLALAYTQTINDHITNEIRGGWQKSDPIFDRTGLPTDFFIQIPLINNPESGLEAQGRFTTITNFQDNASWLKGAHALRFGGQMQIYHFKIFGPPAFASSSLPTFVVGTSTASPSLTAARFPGGISSTQLTTANNLLALLAGIVGAGNQTFAAADKTSGFVQGISNTHRLQFNNFSGYFSDQWRVKPQLTFNFGVRYELYTAIREPNGFVLEPLIPDGADPVAAILNPNGVYDFVGNNAGGRQGAGTKLFKPDRNNFAPVFSLAWSPEFKNSWLKAIFPGDGKTVLRAGYRESYVNDEFIRAADNAATGNAGLVSTVNALNPATGSTALNARFSALPTVATPLFKVPRTFADNNTAAFSRFGTVFAVDPNLKIPRTQEYNFSIQREIGAQTAFEIRYVGAHSSNLVRGIDYNQIDIFNNGFLADFNRARANLQLTGNAACATAGCQTLTVFPLLGSGGLLTNATIVNQLNVGTPADLALIYIQNGLTGTVRFLPNPNTGVADLLTNSAKFTYNSLQTEIRHRFSHGLALQANYTFQKTLTDAGGVGQTRFDPPLNLFGPELEYSRALFDQTHVFNLNTIYELPIGKGKALMGNANGWVDKVVGGFEVTSIIRLATGAPISILDARGTFNRVGRSASQTAVSSLNKDEIKKLVGIFKTNCGVFFIDPKVIDFNMATCNSAAQPGAGTGRGARGFGTAAFPGQVFFNNAPGQTSGLERLFINGPRFFNWDASIIKNVQLKERLRMQLRLEAFNVINRTNFFTGSFDINSSNFGRVTQTATNPRIVQLVGRIEF